MYAVRLMVVHPFYRGRGVCIICNAHAQVMESENSITLAIYQCQHIYSTRMALSLVQCEPKGWDRGRWVDIYTQMVKTAWLWLWVLLMNILSRTGTT